MGPVTEAGATFGFGFSRLLAVGLYLGKPLLPSTHLEPIVRETHLAARVAQEVNDGALDSALTIMEKSIRL